VTKLNASGRVVFGSTVAVEDQDGGAKLVYQLVGDDEADIKNGLLSVSHPSAVRLSQVRSDVVDVNAPGDPQLRDRVGPLRLTRFLLGACFA